MQKHNLILIWLMCVLVLTPCTVQAAEDTCISVTYCYGEVSTGTAKVYSEPNKNSKVVSELYYGERVEGKAVNNDRWLELKSGYIQINNVEFGELKSRNYTMPSNSGYKSFMYASAIRSWDPAQVKQQAKIDSNGILTVDNRFCVAIGTAANVRVGQYFDAILANGEVIHCVKCDTKANVDTFSNNMITRHNGCGLEFVVDKYSLVSKVRTAGNMSALKKSWASPVVKLEIYDYNVLNK